MKGAAYIENDPFAAAWLRELIKDGQIADGEVLEQSIEDILPRDLDGFAQVHAFAGVGVWSLAARWAGWPDDRPLWTASCPCPPFSSAGKKKCCPRCASQVLIPCPSRTGFFICCLCDHAWLADGRHLWPEFWRLVRDCRPDRVLGEQVSSADGRVWVDLVRASLEIMDYTVGVLDTCASGHGGPHIRQRLYWSALANTVPAGRTEGRSWARRRSPSSSSSSTGKLANADGRDAGAEGLQRGREHGLLAQDRSALREGHQGAWTGPSHVVDAESEQAGLPGRTWEPGGTGDGSLADALRGRAEHGPGEGLGAQAEADSKDRGLQGQRLRPGFEGPTGLLADDDDDERRDRSGAQPEQGRRREPADDSLMGHHHHQGLEIGQVSTVEPGALRIEGSTLGATGLVRGRWAGADWIFCRDGKWRPAQPSSLALATRDTDRLVSRGHAREDVEAAIRSSWFPLAKGEKNRVGRLRGYGNALCAPVAQAFVEAVMDVLDTSL